MICIVGPLFTVALILLLTHCGAKNEAPVAAQLPSIVPDTPPQQPASVPEMNAGSAPATPVPESSPAPNDNLEAHARGLIDLMVRNEFDSVAREFDATMASVMPAAGLRQAWESLTAQAGKLLKQEKSRTDELGGLHAVVVTCAFERAELDIRLVFNDARQISGLWFLPAEKPADDTPPSYVAPGSFTEEEVTVGAPDWPLPGTLTTPKGDGPFPAVVLVHGSGPMDRDETVGPNKPFRDLAWGLASRGVAVLRYDKRTKAHGAAIAAKAVALTVKEEVVDDALAAVTFLEGDSRIDKARVFLLGHSLGAMLIPRIAQQAQTAETPLSGFIAMAPPAQSLEKCVLNQTIYLSELDGKVSEEEKAHIQQIRAAIEQIAQLASKDSGVPAGILGAPASYWLDLRDYDAPVAAKGVAKPMLVLHGARDYQVTQEDFERWKSALSERKDVDFKTYPALNHLFIQGEGPSGPAEYETPGHVDGQVVTKIAEWIRQASL
ncbi:MAG: alpha/beta fold hydrolase [Candidatus Hydrogenedentales bacterium]|jgi:hypothetical protein